MVKIILEPAKNGIIKKIVDDNHGGSSEVWGSVEVYEKTETDNLNYAMRFFFDICEDLGIHLGGKFEKDVITITKTWGSHYTPTNDDINQKIKELEAQIHLLQECQTS